MTNLVALFYLSSPQTKPKLQARLKRAAGQLAGLQKMVSEDRYCVDILTQLAALRSALDAAGAAVDDAAAAVDGCLSRFAAANGAGADTVNTGAAVAALTSTLAATGGAP